MNKIEYNGVLKYRSKGLNYTIETKEYINHANDMILKSNTNIEKIILKMFKKTIDYEVTSVDVEISVKKNDEYIVLNRYYNGTYNIYERYHIKNIYDSYLDMEKIEGCENFIKILKKDIKDIKATIKENLQNEIIE